MSGWFERAVQIVLEKEGVLSDDARDPGGLTKYGITKREYPDLDIANITVADAVAIYRRDYWAKIRGDDLEYGPGDNAVIFRAPRFHAIEALEPSSILNVFEKAV